MTEVSPIKGVYLSEQADLKQMFGGYFAQFSEKVCLKTEDEIEDPKNIRFALCWYPAANAFERYPNIKLVASTAAGVDGLLECPSLPDKAYITRIRDEAQATQIAGFAVWHVVWHHRKMGTYLTNQAAGIWQAQYPCVLPRDLQVGILGYGLMGAAIAKAVAAAGFPVTAAVRNSPTQAPAASGIQFVSGSDSIPRVAAISNILINILPLTAETRNVLNINLFSLMPRGAALIQLGRGQHLVDDDLDQALVSGQLSGASLDVFRQEPLPDRHRWWLDEKILITPHQASDSHRSVVAEQVTQAAMDVAAERRPTNAIDRKSGY